MAVHWQEGMLDLGIKFAILPALQLEYYKQIEDLRSMQDEAGKKLNELKEASDDVWEDLKAGTDSAWDFLSRSIKSATSRFDGNLTCVVYKDDIPGQFQAALKVGNKVLSCLIFCFIIQGVKSP